MVALISTLVAHTDTRLNERGVFFLPQNMLEKRWYIGHYDLSV